MNVKAIWRSCNHAESVYFRSFYIHSRSSVSRRCTAVVYEIKRCLPTPIMESSWIKRDSSEKRTHDLRSRGGGLNNSTKTDWSVLNEHRELRDG